MTHAVPEAPRRWGYYHGWNVVAATMLAQVAAGGLTFQSLSLFLRDWSAEFGTPISTLQLCGFGLTVTGAMTAPLAGMLADRYPPRLVFGCGLLTMAAFFLAISFVSAGWQVIALYSTLGPLGMSLSTSVPANTLIARWFSRRIGRAVGIGALGIGLAGLIVPPLVAWSLPALGWRTVWRVAGALMACVILPVVLLALRNGPRAEEAAVEHARPAANDARAAGSPAFGRHFGIRHVMARRNFWLILAAFVPLLAVFGGVAENLAPYSATHGIGHQSAAALISLLSLTQLFSMLGTGFVADRFGTRVPSALLAGVVAVGVAVLALASGPGMVVLGVALIGLCGGMFTLLAAALRDEFGPQAFGRAYGASQIFIPFASLSAFSIARLHESTGSYAPPLLGLAALVLAGGCLGLVVPPSPRSVQRCGA